MRKLFTQVGVSQQGFELRLGVLLPAFLIFSLLVNFGITRPWALVLPEFAPVVVHASSYANYSRDPLDLSFPPVDPEIMDETKKDQSSIPDDQEQQNNGAGPTASPGQSTATQQQGTPTPTAGPNQPTPTPTSGLATLPSVLPTITLGLPTLPSVLPTNTLGLPTNPIAVPTSIPTQIQTAVSSIVPTAVATLIPAIVPTTCVLGICW